MRSKKTYIIIIFILLSFAAIMYFAIGKDYLNAEKRSTYIIVGDTSVWKYKNKNWVNVNKKTIENLYWTEFNVFEDSQKLGKYYVWNDDTNWLYFDKDKNEKEIIGKKLAYQANYDINIDNFDEKELDQSDELYIKQIYEDNDLGNDNKFTTSYKVEIDFDKDNIKETFYVISNAFPLDFEPNKIFSIVFMVKDDEINYLYKNIDRYQGTNGCKPYINYFLDVNKDNKDEIILSCGKYSERGTTDMLYNYENNEFKILISNQ